MELELESMTETYVLSRRVTASEALSEDTPYQSELKTLLMVVSNRARLWNVYYSCL